MDYDKTQMENTTSKETESHDYMDELSDAILDKPFIDPVDSSRKERRMEDPTIRESNIVYAGVEVADKPYKHQKFVALYKARTILSQAGTMQERSIVKKQLARMKKLGLESV